MPAPRWVTFVPEAAPSFDPAEQLAELERDGVYGAVLIARITVFDLGPRPRSRAAYCRVVNDWLAETWGPYLDRVVPGILLPYKRRRCLVKELERAAAMGLRPALLPDGIFERPYHLAEWEPLWEVAYYLKVPFTMHVGGTRAVPTRTRRPRSIPASPTSPGTRCAAGMGETLGWPDLQRHVFEKYPDLHLVMTEGYAGWLGFAMQFFDHHWNDSRLHDSASVPVRPLRRSTRRRASI